MVLTSFYLFPTQKGNDEGEQTLDLDIRVVEYPTETPRASGGSDYLTCKTDSTCDDSDAC